MRTHCCEICGKGISQFYAKTQLAGPMAKLCSLLTHGQNTVVEVALPLCSIKTCVQMNQLLKLIWRAWWQNLLIFPPSRYRATLFIWSGVSDYLTFVFCFFYQLLQSSAIAEFFLCVQQLVSNFVSVPFGVGQVAQYTKHYTCIVCQNTEIKDAECWSIKLFTQGMV